MRIWLKNVTRAWVDTVETLASPDELAIWQADGYRAWRPAQPGDRVLFRPEDRALAIVSHGTYLETTVQFAETAHALFGVGLGVQSYDDLLTQLNERRTRPSGPKPVIATALFKDPHLFPASQPYELPWPFDVADTGVPLCSSRSNRGQTLLAALRDHGRPGTGYNEASEQKLVERSSGHNRSRRPQWSSLRSMTMRLYGHRCALTGERVSAVLDVIHCRSRSKGGLDALGNLLTLQTDYHRLVERNLLAFDEEYRVMLSGQLSLFEDTKYLKLDRLKLRPRLFGHPWPDEASLRWLREKFKGPRYKA